MPRQLKQGQHPDPLDQAQPRPDPGQWSARQRQAFGSREMRLYRHALRLYAQSDVRHSVLDDLSTFFDLEPAESARRCIEWERWAQKEWYEERRDSSEAIAAFYRKTRSWAFDLLWYAYLQAEGYCYPVSVAIAQTLPEAEPGMRHLDFGSGIGATSQLFARRGYATTLADISTSLLAFARFRLERRGDHASYLDLNAATLEADRYDVITAIDTLVHIPDVPGTAQMLHRALRPRGLLFANFDVRPKSAENAAFLYEDDLPLRWHLQRAGFEPEVDLDGMITQYRRVETQSFAHRLRGMRDLALLRGPIRPAYRSVRLRLRDLARRRRMTPAPTRST